MRGFRRVLLSWTALASTASGLDVPPAPSGPGTSRALIVVGLPGDPEHDALFRSTAGRWRDWLAGPLGFPPAEVRVLSADAASRVSIAAEAESIRRKSSPDDRLWVLVLGHANLDEGHAFLHLPGPDLRDDEFAALFKGLAAREQVFWLTTAASGAFLPALSGPGRVVVAATGPSGESNETEFPHVLAEIAGRPAGTLDLDRDGQVSVREVFEATASGVEARFAADKRLPTEHARLDDNGDGVGTEPGAGPKPANPDGDLASRTIVYKPPIRSENGSNRTAPPAR